MEKTAKAGVAGLVQEIEHYVASHPNAADSLEGVMHWWLSAEGPKRDAAMVRHALARLVEAGCLREMPLPDGRVLYAVSDRR